MVGRGQHWYTAGPASPQCSVGPVPVHACRTTAWLMLCQTQARNKVSLWYAMLLLVCMQTKAGGTSSDTVQRVATSSAAKHGVAASDKALDHCLLKCC